MDGLVRAIDGCGRAGLEPSPCSNYSTEQLRYEMAGRRLKLRQEVAPHMLWYSEHAVDLIKYHGSFGAINEQKGAGGR